MADDVSFMVIVNIYSLMNRILMVALLVASGLSAGAEGISSVESDGSWVYLYNDLGKRYKTLSSSSVGTVVWYGATFFVSQNKNWIYLWDAEGKKYKTISKSTVGYVTGVSGDTFTSRNGNWIYTWNKDGKKINTRPAR